MKLFHNVLFAQGQFDVEIVQPEGPGLLFWVIYLAVVVVVLAGVWKTFAKAGKPGWACIVPIYNIIVMLEIAKKPLWWIILFFIPIVNLVVVFIWAFAFAEKYGKGGGFALGLLFLPFIFYPILGFGDAVYRG